MPQILTCTCGKKLRVNDDKIGKRVKCPKCGEALLVADPESEDEPPVLAKTKRKPVPVDDESEEDGADEKPPKDLKKKAKAPAQSSSGRVVLLVILGGVLLVGGCGGVGAAVWFLVLPRLSPTKNITPTPKTTDPKSEKDDFIESRARFSANLGKDGDARSIKKLLLSHDGKRAVLSSGAFKSQIWDITGEPKKLRDLDGEFHALSPDGKRATMQKKGGSALLDTETGDELAKGIFGYGWFLSNQVFQTLNTFRDFRNKVRVISYDATTGKQNKEREIDQKGDRFYLVQETSEIIQVSKSATVHFWDAKSESWTRQVSLKTDAGESLSLDGYAGAVSSDGKWLLAQVGRQTFDPTVFDLTTGAAAKLPKKDFFPHTPAFVPNRNILLANSGTVAKKNAVVAYDVKINTVVGRFGNMEASVRCLAVSGDGSTLAVGTWEGEVAIFDLKKLK